MRKGISELGVIFALFLAIIIIMVVLFMFLGMAQKAPIQFNQATIGFLTDQQINRALQQCRSSCEIAFDDQSALAYCGKTIDIESERGVKIIPKPGRYGDAVFCKMKIPCLALIDSCQGKYTPAACRQLLLDDASSHPLYNALVKNVDSNRVTADDGCGLPTTGELASANWKLQGGFTDLGTALGP